MQTIRCEKCDKVLMEAEGQAHIRKICPKCKTVNEISIGEPKLTSEFVGGIIKK